MATITQHAPGTFCWPELASIDQPGAKTFYSKLFGWEFRTRTSAAASSTPCSG